MSFWSEGASPDIGGSRFIVCVGGSWTPFLGIHWNPVTGPYYPVIGPYMQKKKRKKIDSHIKTNGIWGGV